MSPDEQASIESVLDPSVGLFHQDWHSLAPPAELLHYTSAESVLSIAKHGHLWLTAQPSPGDPLEIHWGNSVLRHAMETVHLESASPSLRRMLDDPTASLFAAEKEMCVACFTDDWNQWERRYPDGAALVFEASKLSLGARNTIEASGLIKVMYSENALADPTRRFLLRAIDAIAGLNLDDEGERLVAQYLMEPGVLAFYSKRECWTWEREWRLVERLQLGRKLIKEHPRRRIELPIRSAESGLRRVVLGPRASAETEERLRDLFAAWPWAIDVARPTS